MFIVLRFLIVSKVGMQTLFNVRKSQIRLGSFRYRKSANFLGVPIRKPQIRKSSWLIHKSANFFQNTVSTQS